MNYRLLGNSGLYVSEICFGVMTFTGSGGWTHLGEMKQKEADNLTKTAIDNGINIFDTADFYSEGNSEKMLGKALGPGRKDVIITTKFGFRMKKGPNGEGLSKSRIIEACEESLRRLGTDYIDIYLIHSLDFVTPLEETLGGLTQLVREGKVRYIGCSNFPSWMLIKAAQISDKKNLEKIVAHQAYYSLLGRDIELDIIPASMESGIGTMVWSPLHGGILTGKYHNISKWPENTRIKAPGDQLPMDIKASRKILDELFRISEKRNVSVSQVSLNYLLRKRGISTLVIGARNKKQLMDNIHTVEWSLSDEEVKRLDILSEPKAIYPHWYYNILKREL